MKISVPGARPDGRCERQPAGESVARHPRWRRH